MLDCIGNNGHHEAGIAIAQEQGVNSDYHLRIAYDVQVGINNITNDPPVALVAIPNAVLPNQHVVGERISDAGRRVISYDAANTLNALTAERLNVTNHFNGQVNGNYVIGAMNLGHNMDGAI